MPDTCKRCNRPRTREEINPQTGKRTRTRRQDHQCEIAVLVRPSERDDPSPYCKTVHLSRVEPDGNLYSATHGKKPEWEVIHRSTSRIEKAVRKQSTEGKKRLKSRQQKKREKASKEE